MRSVEIRDRYLNFFSRRGHVVTPSASLIPENDPTVLFTTAGMHPLVPYLLGEMHPSGRRLVNLQKCIRTGDIDDVGDSRHLTFFEMLGNWSLGDYFKEEAINWTFDFLTSKEEGLGLNPERLYATVFEGDDIVPKDQEAINIWQQVFSRHNVSTDVGGRIFLLGRKDNWWGPAGQTGPCGPDSEIYYDTTNELDRTIHIGGWSGIVNQPCQPGCDCGRYLEIGNNVFMQYFKKADGQFEPLAQRNVDFGGGFERLAMVTQGAKSVFETDLFRPIISEIERRTGRLYGEDLETNKAIRIIADHLRAAIFILGDERGITPSNLDQGYILRRLIRRAFRYGRQLGLEAPFLSSLGAALIGFYSEMHPSLAVRSEHIVSELESEERKFEEALDKGLIQARKLGEKYAAADRIPGEEAFYLYETFGFPRQLTEEVLGKPVDVPAFEERFKKHQALSRSGAEQKFSGGLADHSLEVVRLHTATHLLHRALRQVLGDHVEQKGSNITKDRLRFDFTHGEKLTDEQKNKVEQIVNDQISANLPVHFEMMTVAEAKSAGAIGLFEDKYATLGDQVKVYFVGNPESGYFSVEICGGPHVEHTGELGSFKIKKEESSSAGIRRIKAVLG